MKLYCDPWLALKQKKAMERALAQAKRDHAEKRITFVHCCQVQANVQKAELICDYARFITATWQNPLRGYEVKSWPVGIFTKFCDAFFDEPKQTQENITQSTKQQLLSFLKKHAQHDACIDILAAALLGLEIGQVLDPEKKEIEHYIEKVNTLCQPEQIITLLNTLTKRYPEITGKNHQLKQLATHKLMTRVIGLLDKKQVKDHLGYQATINNYCRCTFDAFSSLTSALEKNNPHQNFSQQLDAQKATAIIQIKNITDLSLRQEIALNALKNAIKIPGRFRTFLYWLSEPLAAWFKIKKTSIFTRQHLTDLCLLTGETAFHTTMAKHPLLEQLLVEELNLPTDSLNQSILETIKKLPLHSVPASEISAPKPSISTTEKVTLPVTQVQQPKALYNIITIPSDGNCAYAAYGFNKRQEIFDLFIQQKQNHSFIKQFFSTALKAELIRNQPDEVATKEDKNKNRVANCFLHYATQTASIPPKLQDQITILQQYNAEEIYDGIVDSNNPAVLEFFYEAFLQFNILRITGDHGWAYLSVLQGLAELQGKTLYVWEQGTSDILLPYKLSDEFDYGRYRSTKLKVDEENSENRIDLLFVNNNHFNKIEFIGDMPNEKTTDFKLEARKDSAPPTPPPTHADRPHIKPESMIIDSGSLPRNVVA